jgi:NAD(P)-dependent dehydrogenase (short-subunit alcohol dehydrogenase family)
VCSSDLKIAAAAGGNVTITYAAGYTDALRIQSEIRAGGGKCAVAALDVLAPLSRQLVQAFSSDAPDDIFYFASPIIDVSKHPVWRPQLFQRFVDYYVTGFSKLIDQLVSLRVNGSRGLRVFYPSTVFLDTPPAGSLEYCAAKAAGEVICRGWATRRQGIEVVYPRIPRLLTDQTASRRSGALQLPADYMLSILAGWRSCGE